jgi:hypothetical protein
MSTETANHVFGDEYWNGIAAGVSPHDATSTAYRHRPTEPLPTEIPGKESPVVFCPGCPIAGGVINAATIEDGVLDENTGIWLQWRDRVGHCTRRVNVICHPDTRDLGADEYDQITELVEDRITGCEGPWLRRRLRAGAIICGAFGTNAAQTPRLDVDIPAVEHQPEVFVGTDVYSSHDPCS